MTVDTVSIVLLGENFPLQSIDLDDFVFLGQPFDEKLVIPVAIQAVNKNYRLQVLPDRFDVRCESISDVDAAVEELIRLSETFLEYAGRRTVRAVGHNFTRTLSGIESDRSDAVDWAISRDELSELLQSPGDIAADIVLHFRRGQEDRARLVINTSSEMHVSLDFNFHYELRSRKDITVEHVIRLAPESLAIADELVGRFEARVEEGTAQ